MTPAVIAGVGIIVASGFLLLAASRLLVLYTEPRPIVRYHPAVIDYDLAVERVLVDAEGEGHGSHVDFDWDFAIDGPLGDGRWRSTLHGYELTHESAEDAASSLLIRIRKGVKPARRSAR